jgi:hypothetical protein
VQPSTTRQVVAADGRLTARREAMEKIMWLVLGVVIATCAVRAHRSARARAAARLAIGVLFVGFGAVVNLVYLLGDSEQFATFGDISPIPFVRDTWASLVAPNLWFWISLLIAFEAIAGILVLSGGRRARIGLVALIGFHIGLLAFGWMAAWAVPMILALGLLLHAENQPAPEHVAPSDLQAPERSAPLETAAR